MKLSVKSGSSIAAAAASLILANVVAAPTVFADEAKGRCVGGNACAGQSACKTATNACKGQNACTGQGFTQTTKDECSKIEGTTFEPAK